MMFYVFLHIFVLFALFRSNVGEKNEQALKKILTEQNPDTAENLERIRRIIEGAVEKSKKASDSSIVEENETKKPVLGTPPPFDRAYNESKFVRFERINKDINDYTFESDIMLNEEQAKIIAQNIENSHNRTKRQAIVNKNLFWNVNSPIYYQFDPKLTSTNIANVRKGIQFWQANSCLNFVESSTASNRLYLTSAGGCWSYVGKQSTATQLVSVGPGCDSLGTATHELAHALGFWHQQSRADRDYYVYIDFSNINAGQRHNFEKMSENQAQLLGMPYDYGSVMQYYPYAFAINNRKYTVYAQNSLYQNTLGQREKPAFSDILMINKLYQCSNRCRQLSCSHNGFPNPRNCNVCKCPQFFSGTYCTNLPIGTAPNCNGRILRATSSWTRFNALAGNPNSYATLSTSSDCYWHIQAAQTNQKVELRMVVSPSSSICVEGCQWQSVEINLGNFDTYGMITCCNNLLNRTFRTKNNLAAIRGTVRYNQLKFTIEYRSV